MISSISFIFGNLCFYHMHHTTMDFAQVLTFVLKKKKHLKKKTCTGQVVPFCSLAISTTMMKFICQEKKGSRGRPGATTWPCAAAGYVQHKTCHKRATRGKRIKRKDENLVIGSVVGPQTEPSRGHPPSRANTLTKSLAITFSQ